MLNALRRQNHLMPLLTFAICCLTFTFSYFVHPIVSAILFVFMFAIFLIEVVTQFSFLAPKKRKPAIEILEWNPTQIQLHGHHIMCYFKFKSTNSPTVWICHGWASSSQRMQERANLCFENGYNVLMFDLPSHGGSSALTKWTAQQSTTLLIMAANEHMANHPHVLKNEVFFYGHSMGAFIGLRLSSRRDELKCGDNLRGWIFESPMTGYTEIFTQTCNTMHVPKLFRPWLLSNTLKHVNAINHDTLKIKDLAETDMPLWGIPDEPTLVIQANPDERLGEKHYERMIRSMKDAGKSELMECHLLNTLKHSGANAHPERDVLVQEWLERRLTYSSD